MRPLPKYKTDLPTLDTPALTKIIDQHEERLQSAEGFIWERLATSVADNNGLRTVLLFLMAELSIKRVLTPAGLVEMLRAAGAVAGTGRHEIDALAGRFKEWSTGTVGGRPRPTVVTGHVEHDEHGRRLDPAER